MIHIEKKGRPHAKLDFVELAKLTEGYVASDIEAICDEVARDASRHILEAALTIDETKELISIDDLKTTGITMKTLRQAIKDTPTSLKMEDMIAINTWRESL